ncbi:hypothetical protein KC333_g6737 [Hortaea werneckii]|nr:hypothetical protein KC333_g6737 [Hortaea werneckii]KAI7310536.1 hypothetical protein KC326_g6640 [Hortaea werneckii]
MADFTTPVKLIPTRGDDTKARYLDRQLTATSKVLTAKFDRWSTNNEAEEPKAEVEASGATVTVYVSTRLGTMSPDLSVRQLFKTYMLADYLLDDTSKDLLIDEIIPKCVRSQDLNGVNLDKVMDKLPPSDALTKFCVDFSIRKGVKEGKFPEDSPAELGKMIAARMVEIMATEGNARRTIGLVFGCKTRPKTFRYCDYHQHEAGKKTPTCNTETDRM